MPRRTWVTAVLILLAATIAIAAPGVVKTKTGQIYEGEVNEQAEQVSVNVRGIDTVIPRDQIESIEYGTFEELFEKKLAALAADDANGRIALARDAFAARRYLLAARALEMALAIDPNNEDAVRFLNLVRQQLRLQRGGDDNDTTPPTAPSSPPTPRMERRLLDGDQINLIRLHEMRADEHIPVRIDPDTRRQIVEKMNVTVQQFNQGTPAQQARYILENGTPEMLTGVRVNRDPEALQVFRQRVLPVVVQGCATANCHGGATGAGGFYLYSGADEATAYTNFMILSTYAKKLTSGASGVFGGEVDVRMIDRGQADRSLLLNYAFPGSIAEHDHPKV
ncbi:MAG TPA: hypothetical protein PKB10_01230, partial [Tepidisphaeraceae bacterium]|nr:hypothetical protein [Tepidisphaeraceae bacterium]